MLKTLGLDISTSIIGCCIITYENKTIQKISLSHIDLRKEKNFFKKCELVKIYLEKFNSEENISNIIIEESLQRYKLGRSSAHTLSLLSKMNGAVSYICFSIFNLFPAYISSISARKICEIKIIKDPSLSAKQQTFDWVTNKLNKSWEKTKNGNIQKWCYDEVDAFVLAYALFLKN